jgi:hypothetical protein
VSEHDAPRRSSGEFTDDLLSGGGRPKVAVRRKPHRLLTELLGDGGGDLVVMSCSGTKPHRWATEEVSEHPMVHPHFLGRLVGVRCTGDPIRLSPIDAEREMPGSVIPDFKQRGRHEFLHHDRVGLDPPPVEKQRGGDSLRPEDIEERPIHPATPGAPARIKRERKRWLQR